MAKTMFKVYLYDWAKDYNVTTEKYTLVDQTLALSIPVDSKDKIWFLSPTVKAEVNKAESFDFTVEPGTEYYNAFIPLKTWLRVVYDTTTIFWGRVKTISNTGYAQKRSIHAEGVYSILTETPVEGLEEELQTGMTGIEYLKYLINNHNNFVEENKKKLERGNINVTLNSTSKKRRPTGWSTTVAEIDHLIDETGGLVRARYNEGITVNTGPQNYIDWARYYFRDLGDGKRPVIKLARNLVDISKNAESNEIFTRLIPIGHKDSNTTTSSSSKQKTSNFVYVGSPQYIKIKDVPGMISSDVSKQKAELEADGFRKIKDFTDAEKNYGVIYKTQNFPNASSASELKTYALDWIKHNYYGIIPNFSIRAIDMHMLGESEPQILVGDCVDVTYPEFDNDGTQHLITRKLICKAAQYNLLNPETNVYTFGVPCDAIDFEYGEKAKKKSNSKSTAQDTGASRTPTSSGGGGNTKITWEMVLRWLRYYYYAVPHKKVVSWTETRWSIAKPGTNPVVWSRYERDLMPYNTFKDNGEYCAVKEVDEDGQPKEYEYYYAYFTPPGTTQRTKGRILGHYKIDKTKVKHKMYSYADYEYGVCVVNDHAYAFSWEDYTRKKATGNLETLTIPTFFEIVAVAYGAEELTAEDLEAATSDPGETVGPTTWVNYDGKTTAEIAAENGTSTFLFLEDEDGKRYPAVYVDGKGVVTAVDLALPKIDSFETEVAYIHSLINDRAAIGELRACMAVLGDDKNFDDNSYEKDANGNIITDPNGNYKLKTGTKFMTNAQKIVGASGAYYYKEKYDPKTGKTEVDMVIKDGAGFLIEKENPNNPGHTATFGVWDKGNLDGGIMAQMINGQSQTLINGNVIQIGDGNTSRILTSATDELAQIVGTYEWTIQNGKKVGIKGITGNGAYVYRNGAKFGIFDKGNLDGGIIIEKINKETKTTITGDHIQIGTSTTKGVKLTDAIEINAQGLLQAKNSLYVKGNLYVSASGNSPGTVSASNVVIGIGGTLGFTMRSGSGGGVYNLNASTVSKLIDTSTPHVRITGPDKNDEYTLWYLPASADAIESNWKKCQTFSSATTLTGSWDGGSGRDPGYFRLKSPSGKLRYSINFGGTDSGFDQYLVLNASDTDMSYYNAVNKNIRADVVLQSSYKGGSGSYTGPTRYKKQLYFDATPAFNGGYDDAAGKVRTPATGSSDTLDFIFPISKKSGSTIIRATDSLSLTLRSTNNDAYVSTGSEGSYKNYAHIKHNKYDEGRTYEKSIIYTGFRYDSANSRYCIYPYEGIVPHGALINGQTPYKLAINTAQTAVFIADSGGTRISNTPTYTLPKYEIKVTTVNSYTHDIETCKSGDGIQNAAVMLNVESLNYSTGSRKIGYIISGYGAAGTGTYKQREYTGSYTLYDYDNGYQAGLKEAANSNPGGGGTTYAHSGTFLVSVGTGGTSVTLTHTYSYGGAYADGFADGDNVTMHWN